MYEIIKTIHIISACILFGTGLGSAFYLWRAHHSNDIPYLARTIKQVVIADWIFTTPTAIIQPLSGVWLMHILQLQLNHTWLLTSLLLFIMAGGSWLIVVWLQIKMRELVNTALLAQTRLPQAYYRYFRLWFLLGWPAFIAILIIFYLMVGKPAL